MHGSLLLRSRPPSAPAIHQGDACIIPTVDHNMPPKTHRMVLREHGLRGSMGRAWQDTLTRNVQAAARTFGLELHVLNASTESDIDTVFTTLGQLRADGLIIGSDVLFSTLSEQLAALTLRHTMPAVFQERGFAAAGGLLTYGGSVSYSYRQVGVYTARILKGAKPADLPVVQGTKFELVINLRTAKALGLNLPSGLLNAADEV